MCRKRWCKQDTHTFKLQSNYLLLYAHSWEWQVPRLSRAGRDLTATGENSVPLFPGTGSPPELLSCHPWTPVFDSGLYAFPGRDILHLNSLASVCKVIFLILSSPSWHTVSQLLLTIWWFSWKSEWGLCCFASKEPQVTDGWNKRRRVTEEVLPWSLLSVAVCWAGWLVWKIWHTSPLGWHRAKSPYLGLGKTAWK